MDLDLFNFITAEPDRWYPVFIHQTRTEEPLSIWCQSVVRLSSATKLWRYYPRWHECGSPEEVLQKIAEGSYIFVRGCEESDYGRVFIPYETAGLAVYEYPGLAVYEYPGQGRKYPITEELYF